jgi:hypothetical protein
MKQSLKPCPFCGANADTRVFNTGERLTIGIRCDSCAAKIEKNNVESGRKAWELLRLASKWNTRQSPWTKIEGPETLPEVNIDVLIDSYGDISVAAWNGSEWICQADGNTDEKPGNSHYPPSVSVTVSLEDVSHWMHPIKPEPPRSL